MSEISLFWKEQAICLGPNIKTQIPNIYASYNVKVSVIEKMIFTIIDMNLQGYILEINLLHKACCDVQR